MAAVNQQGSRAGLITTLVFSVVVAIVFVITTFYYNSELLKERAKGAELKTKYAVFATDDDTGSEGRFATSNIDLMKASLNMKGAVAVPDLLIAQRDQVIQSALGQGPILTFDKAIEKIQGAIAEAAKAAPGAKVATTDTVPDALAKLAKALTAQEAVAKAAVAERDKKTGEVTAAQASLKAQVEELQKQLEDAKVKVAEAITAQTTAQTAYADMQAKATESVKTASTDAEKKVAECLAAKQDADAKTEKAVQEVAKIKAYLIRYRLDTKAHMFAAAPDGTIIRLGAGNRVYIDLGSSDHLPPGLNFEVYNKGEGIPVTKADVLSNSGLPEGKASIEVLRIGQNVTECRVVHLAPNQTISQGDIIANLVYDRNTSYHFFVYGEFDVDQNGVASTAEGDIIKSLATRWGGKVDTKISIETDFVILGREPKIPSYTADELNEPANLDKKNRADAALKAYQAIITSAGDLHIPIMNQNRFLYYVGYYDQAKR